MLTAKDIKLADTQDLFTPAVGIVEGPINCGVCHSVMTEEKEVQHYPSQAMAQAGIAIHVDRFTCPNHREFWHMQAVKLRDLAHQTPSKKLADIYREEATEIIVSRETTK
jgi:hypothetical protein